MSPERSRGRGRAFFTALAVVLACSPTLANECPAEIAGATKIILITADSVNSFKAQIDTFERVAVSDRFQRKLRASPAVVGRNGLALGWSFRSNADAGDNQKVEGDGRTPSGVYKLGRPFGFARTDLPNYLELEAGKTFCVDDPRSQHYNQIVPRSSVPPGTTGENMRLVPGYRHGIVIDYKSDPAAKAGSCIFVHVWRSPQHGTAGCVGVDRKIIVKLQEWTNDEGARIGIFSKPASVEFLKCLGL